MSFSSQTAGRHASLLLKMPTPSLSPLLIYKFTAAGLVLTNDSSYILHRHVAFFLPIGANSSLNAIKNLGWLEHSERSKDKSLTLGLL